MNGMIATCIVVLIIIVMISVVYKTSVLSVFHFLERFSYLFKALQPKKTAFANSPYFTHIAKSTEQIPEIGTSDSDSASGKEVFIGRGPVMRFDFWFNKTN